MNNGDIHFRITASIPHRARVDVGVTSRITTYRAIPVIATAYDSFLAIWSAVADAIRSAARAGLADELTVRS